MGWIKHVPYEEAEGKLKSLYDRVKGSNDYLDNILTIHGLRPNTLEGHMMLYKNVLHHSNNQLPKWMLEAMGVYVSILNHCEYCTEHHFAGLKRLLNDDEKADGMRYAMENDALISVFGGKELALIRYTQLLTETPAIVDEEVIDQMRSVGLTDGEILEANQVIAYFGYANRTVMGLGVSTHGDILGLSPNDSDDETNWNHN
jgi:uncharacterized peroxidase-related enzyme